MLPRPPPLSLGSPHSPPEGIGIHALDIYFPLQYVKQSELETYSNVSSGKFTIGLGQSGLSFVGELEDMGSIVLTAVSSFMKKYNIDPLSIGRIEVGTETIQDHSKSLKTLLMTLFEECGNGDIEGIDCYNACYGGTAALFNSCDWMESSNWDGRYAMFVCGDIAEYEEGPARPTNGCGCVVGMVGPNAPLVIQRGTRSTYMENAYDFYKPHLGSPYPVVDGKFSNLCYLKALDKCYKTFNEKHSYHYGGEQKGDIDLDTIEYLCFHGPYNKLVQKAFARLLFNDFVRHRSKPIYQSVQQSPNLASLTLDNPSTYENVELEKAFMALSKPLYESKVKPSTTLPVEVGNMYTASLYASLLSLISNKGDDLSGNRIMMFSYGSGLAASIFMITVGKAPEDQEKLRNIRTKSDIYKRLEERRVVTSASFYDAMRRRLKIGHADGMKMEGNKREELWKGSYYLVEKDKMGKRHYGVYNGEEEENVK